MGTALKLRVGVVDWRGDGIVGGLGAGYFGGVRMVESGNVVVWCKIHVKGGGEVKVRN